MQKTSGILGAFRNALRGITVTVATQRNARVHLLATVLVVGVGHALQVTRKDWLWLCAAIVAVWVAELFNTSIEKLTDLASPQWHPLARDAKDIAAGAVLLIVVGAVAVGVLVFLPYFI